MLPETKTTLDYASPASAKPRRIWLPLALLSLAFVVWYWPRLTPTFFPDSFDWMVLIFLAPGAFATARYSSVPGWAFVAYGAAAVCLFLFANFNDNNFRANTSAHDILLPWSAMVLGGAVLGLVVGHIGRAAGR